ncbi:MAG: nucleotidyltransferase domain-containing protein [Nanoarchaeota archaeon]|nr:nucleotidyltransferase domain-containing protein [Nanoarchaeota archaeon]MBU1946809.1 nucleotidyltransferase domain-containing protein [Nanoarchaeota archaeon]
MIKSLVLTNREQEVIEKKLNKKELTQQDSNYLSRYVRPKLREMSLIESKELLSRLEYNQKTPSIEKYIKNIILKNIPNVSSITLYGSAIYNNYKEYNDIDVLAVVKKKSWDKLGEKLLLTEKIKKMSKLNLDIKLYTEDYIYASYPNNIALIYELNDSKTIYGILRHKQNINLTRLHLKMHSDYSDLIIKEADENGIENISSTKLYTAIRNLWVIRLIMEKTVDNHALNQIMANELGKNLISRLKNNSKSKADKEIAYIYLKNIYITTTKLINSINGEIRWAKNKQ